MLKEMVVFPIKLSFIEMVKRLSVRFLNDHSICVMLGVDDGHFQKVLDHEIRALENACKGIL